MDLMKKKWHRYHYKNLTYVAISIILALFLLRIEGFHNFLFNLGNFGYIGAFIGGLLYVSTFTVSIGSVILIVLAQKLNPVEIGLLGGLGGVIGDFVIFRFIRNRGFVNEVKHLFQYLGGDKITHLIHTKYFSWTLPVIGALIIASPFPDEFGISLMGISRMKTSQFILLSFILDTVGVFLIISASLLFKY